MNKNNNNRYKILELDPYLSPFENDINLRMDRYYALKERLLKDDCKNLSEFASGYKYFGFNKTKGGWYYREWAPNASEVYVYGDFNEWDRRSHKLSPVGGGAFEIFISGEDTIKDGQKVKAIVIANNEEKDKIPLYIKKVFREKDHTFCGEIYAPLNPYEFKEKDFKRNANSSLLIYECHIGMSSEEEKVNTYNDFTDNVLPRVKNLGYNAIQIMAIMEHPYYASFGYQVSNFFAASSWFGTPDDLKRLIDTAHAMGIAVLLDLVHSHAVTNVNEGINLFDGTDYQFFLAGKAGDHPAWGSKIFNYDKPEVVHFLLSNIRFYMEEFKFDGFRFDGVTSMLYTHCGLGVAFDNYNKYFSMDTNLPAINYLMLANELIKEINPNSVSIAEDMSGMPGMCLPLSYGGIGFDYRLSMGIPDMWVRLLAKVKDENWSVNSIYNELVGRRPSEKVIAYAESHDQALVGDKTIMFRLADKEMYTEMKKDSHNLIIDRAISLHKLIYFITLTLGGDGFLNFFGNEFGHPEWIDFPREGNNWSYKYARRQWSLSENKELKFDYLLSFHKAMTKYVTDNKILDGYAKQLYLDEGRKIIAFEKGGHIFVFNFNPGYSETHLVVAVHNKGEYIVEFTGEREEFGGFSRVKEGEKHLTQKIDGYDSLVLYSPARSVVVLKKVKK